MSLTWAWLLVGRSVWSLQVLQYSLFVRVLSCLLQIRQMAPKSPSTTGILVYWSLYMNPTHPILNERLMIILESHSDCQVIIGLITALQNLKGATRFLRLSRVSVFLSSFLSQNHFPSAALNKNDFPDLWLSAPESRSCRVFSFTLPACGSLFPTQSQDESAGRTRRTSAGETFVEQQRCTASAGVCAPTTACGIH